MSCMKKPRCSRIVSLGWLLVSKALTLSVAPVLRASGSRGVDRCSTPIEDAYSCPVGICQRLASQQVVRAVVSSNRAWIRCQSLPRAMQQQGSHRDDRARLGRQPLRRLHVCPVAILQLLQQRPQRVLVLAGESVEHGSRSSAAVWQWQRSV